MSSQGGRRDSRRATRLTDSQTGHLRLTESGILRLRRELPAKEPTPRELSNEPAVRNCSVLCLASMIALLTALIYQEMGSASLIPVLIGIMGVITRWRAAPIFVILSHSSLYYVELIRKYLIEPIEEFPAVKVADLIMAAALVIYVAAHYRLQGLVYEIIPRSARRATRRRPGRQGQPAPELPARRSLAAVSPTEMSETALLGGWVAAALFLWVLLARQSPQIGTHTVRDPIWRGFLLVWVVGVTLLVFGSLVRYLSYRRLSVPEARLWLQDAVWRETHREQRIINGWLAWARLRRQRREGSA